MRRWQQRRSRAANSPCKPSTVMHQVLYVINSGGRVGAGQREAAAAAGQRARRVQQLRLLQLYSPPHPAALSALPCATAAPHGAGGAAALPPYPPLVAAIISSRFYDADYYRRKGGVRTERSVFKGFPDLSSIAGRLAAQQSWRRQRGTVCGVRRRALAITSLCAAGSLPPGKGGRGRRQL